MMFKTLKRMLSKKGLFYNRNLFLDSYSYDLKFNASFRSKSKLSPTDQKLTQIKYLKLYRKAQASKGYLLEFFFHHRLIKLSEKTGIMLFENMNIPKGLIIGHPGTIIVNENAKFGGNIMLTHGVTIGRDIRGKRAGSPTFGKNICVRCNSTIVGGIYIGDDVLIAPNTFVNFDVPSHSIVIGNPASIHHRDHATEGHIGET